MLITPVTRIEQVRQAIVLQILSGTLRPGQRLLEARLSKELGVSQATVNAALQDLHNQGLVSKQLNRSTNVSRYTLEDIERLFKVRIVLEPAAAEAVAAVWTENARQALSDQVELMRRAARVHDLAKFCIADYAFHQEIYRLSGNPFLQQAAQAIAAAPFAYILCDHLEALPTDYLALAENHEEMVQAMQAGPEVASQTARQFILLWLEHSRRALAAVAVGIG